MNFKDKQSTEALKHVLTNVLKLNSESPIRNNLIHNDCDVIEEIVNISDTNIQKLIYETSTKEFKYLFLEYHRLIRYFINYFEYRTYDNEPIGNDWMKINNREFNNLRMKYYYNFIRLR